MSYMRNMKVMGLALVAVFLLGAVGASSASASQPKFVPKGAAFPVAFSASGGVSKLETIGGSVVTCKTSSVPNTAEIADEHKVKKVVITFKTCTAFGGLATCTTSGQASGTIVTNSLEGELVYIGASKNETAIWLWAGNKSKGQIFASFGCTGIIGGTTTVTVRNGTNQGGVECKISPKGPTTSFTFACSQSAGHQSPEGYWNPSGCTNVEDFLESEGVGGVAPFTLQKSGIEGSATITTAANIEIVGTKCE